MNKLLIATTLLTLSASTALATSNHHNNYGGDSNAQAGAIAAQAQGQQQGQSSNNYNKNNVSNYNGNRNSNSNSNANSAASNSNSKSYSGSQAYGGTAKASGGSSKSSSLSRGGNSEVNSSIGTDTEVDASNALENENAASNTTNVIYKRNPVSSAMAAALVAGNDACMGSVSAGAQGVGFGASIGKTYTDESCVRRKDARTLHVLGFGSAGVALLCQDDAIAKAMNDAGTPCTWASSVNDVSFEYKPTPPDRNNVIKSGIFKGAVAEYPTSR